jgi:hypothetical protein
MAFNKAPSSWLTGYTFTSDEISFSLSGDYTAECQDAMGLIFRVTDEILKKYTAKALADRPVQWESTSVIAQPVQGSPNSLKTITNKFVLDAELFAGLATPSLEVTISTPDMVYTGYAYGAVSHTAPTGSSVTITYSADGGQTFSSTAPTARGSYIARIVATKDGRSGTARSGFSILKSTPTVTAGTDITLEYSSGTITTSFFSEASFASVTSSNPAIVSVVSFTAGGAVVLQKNGVGQADIIASTAETSEYYSADGSKTVILEAKTATINAPATLAISVANGLSQALEFTPNFTLTPQRYALMEFESSNDDVATISKGSSYPPTIEIVAGGTFTVTSRFPGDSEYGEALSTTAITISGATPVQAVTISTQASFSGDNGIIVEEPPSPATSPWSSGRLWALRVGLDVDNDDLVDGQIPTLPYVFTITIANDQGQGTSGALSTSFANFVSNNWISFSTSGNTITATISSVPATTITGDVNAGSLLATKAAADGVLAWQGQFDINFYKAGRSYRLQEKGMRSAITNPPTDVSGSAITLNANALYNDSWNNDQPHQAIIFVFPVDGAPSTGITATWGGGSYYTPPPILFDNGQTTKSIIEGIGYNIQINSGGTSTLTITATSGGITTTRAITFNVLKIVPTLSAVQLSPPPCCSSTNSGLAKVEISNSGSGYDFTAAAPTVTVGPPNAIGGTQAVVTATVSGGSITAIAVGSTGSGYTSAPTVTITPAAGDAGTGATAIASLLLGSRTFTVTIGQWWQENPFIDNVSAPALNLLRGYAYTFDQSASSNSSHQIAFKNTDGTTYTTGVVTTGTPGTSGAKTVFTVAGDAPNGLRYYCMTHGEDEGNTIEITGSFSPGANSFIVQTSGTGYNATPTITLSGGGGTGASAGAVTRTLGRISRLTVVNAGSGYYVPPSITIAPPPAPAI